jgi:hypothetical protein
MNSLCLEEVVFDLPKKLVQLSRVIELHASADKLALTFNGITQHYSKILITGLHGVGKSLFTKNLKRIDRSRLVDYFRLDEQSVYFHEKLNYRNQIHYLCDVNSLEHLAFDNWVLEGYCDNIDHIIKRIKPELVLHINKDVNSLSELYKIRYHQVKNSHSYIHNRYSEMCEYTLDDLNTLNDKLKASLNMLSKECDFELGFLTIKSEPNHLHTTWINNY